MRKLGGWKTGLLGALAAGLIGVATHASAGPALTGGNSFERFCSTWMGKLADREKNNLRSAAARKDGSTFAIEYIGYAKAPTRCESRATGVPSNPFIGKLVYHELRYKRSGNTPERAVSADAMVLEAVEVMEIFRFDGKRWVY